MSGDPFVRQILQAWPAGQWLTDRVVVAVSGGADSTALLLAISAIQREPQRIIVAHYNHRLRGPAADGDEEFVAELCLRLGSTFVVGRFAGESAAGGRGEAAARRQRYQFLHETARTHAARYLAVAHTADDQAETILHRIIRGTGLAGLAGIPPVRAIGEACTLVRPMLNATRCDVLQYLQRQNQGFRTDATNLDQCFTRNHIRNVLLPRLQRDYNPQVQRALLRLGQLAAESQAAVDAAISILAGQYVTLAGETVTLQCRTLRSLPAYLRRELFVFIWKEQNWPLREMTFAHWELLDELLDETASSAQTMPGGVQARRHRDSLVLQPPTSTRRQPDPHSSSGLSRTVL